MILFVLSSCTPKLEQQFRDNNNKIYAEQWGSWFPDGYEGLISFNRPGILALGDNDFIFDLQGVKSFTITKANIMNIELSEIKTFKKRVLTITTNDSIEFEFLISKGEDFYNSMNDWME